MRLYADYKVSLDEMDISGRIKNGNNPYGYQPEDIAGTPQEGLYPIFPSASVRYQLNDKHEFIVSYSKESTG